MTLTNPKQPTKILGSDADAIGVEVYDERDIRHIVNIEWSGEIEKHTCEANTYPEQREDLNDEEQRIMLQVEERARYTAQKEFPEEDILHPMWDPAHVKAGIKALGNYPLEQFHESFEEFYEAIIDPESFIERSPIDETSVVVNTSVRFREGDVLSVDGLEITYKTPDGREHCMGGLPDYPEDEQLVISLPKMDFDDDFDYYEDFQDTVMTHLFAQVRDIYLNMGEEPPEEFLVEGIGKYKIIGDGIGDI